MSPLQTSTLRCDDHCITVQARTPLVRHAPLAANGIDVAQNDLEDLSAFSLASAVPLFAEAQKSCWRTIKDWPESNDPSIVIGGHSRAQQHVSASLDFLVRYVRHFDGPCRHLPGSAPLVHEAAVHDAGWSRLPVPQLATYCECRPLMIEAVHLNGTGQLIIGSDVCSLSLSRAALESFT
jgi:hypothetical protein